MSVNKVILVGHLGKDPELRYTPSGVPVCTFTMATSERYKDKSGQLQEQTEWHNIVAWRGLAETCGKYLHKGKQIYVEGKLQTRSYEDRNGGKRYNTEIVISQMQMLGNKGSGYEKVRSDSDKRSDAPLNSNNDNGSLSDEVPYDDPPF